jgi:hypothetical protein
LALGEPLDARVFAVEFPCIHSRAQLHRHSQPSPQRICFILTAFVHKHLVHMN